MSVSGASESAKVVAARLGLSEGDLVAEFGYDDDVDESLRQDIQAVIGSDLLDGNTDDVVDAMLVWWRADDGDLTDELVDAVGMITEEGAVLVATPRPGRPNYVDAADISDAAQIAGLGQPSGAQPSGDWVTVKLTRTKDTGRGRR